ncbi:MAG: hypothetical protein RLZZ374_1774 [Cyanobacteriota bacterium]|jgi:hypothetical protein
MRFFSLSKVKNDISSGALGEQETFKYMIAWFIVFCLDSFPGSPEGASAAYYAFWVVSSVVNIWGIRKSYAANGGARGSSFIGRFLALGWVLGIRGLIVFIPSFVLLCVLLGVLIAMTGMLQNGTEQVVAEYALFSSLIVYMVWYYSRLCANLRELRAGGA